MLLYSIKMGYDYKMDDGIWYNALNIETETNHRKLAKLIATHGSWHRAWEAVCRVGGLQTDTTDPKQAWEELHRRGIRLILRNEKEFPNLLTEAPWAPQGIYVLGTLREEPLSIAVVGTRKATGEGKATAKKFARELAGKGFAVVSGLALGIDGAAHEGCLDAKGYTVAVLANGLDHIYPRTHEKLAAKILEAGGAIVSEYPCGAPPFPNRFLERNRIVAGISRGALVIEAPKNSGSLATARFALEANRDVFVTPGPISHPNFFGSHELIRNGAHLVATAEHMLESFGIETGKTAGENNAFENPEEQAIYDALRNASAPADTDAIAEITGLATQNVNRALSMLIIKNIVKETEDGYTLENE